MVKTAIMDGARRIRRHMEGRGGGTARKMSKERISKQNEGILEDWRGWAGFQGGEGDRPVRGPALKPWS